MESKAAKAAIAEIERLRGSFEKEFEKENNKKRADRRVRQFVDAIKEITHEYNISGRSEVVESVYDILMKPS